MSVATKIKEKSEALTAKRAELHGIFTEAGSDLDMDKVKSIEGDSAAKVAEIRKRNEEIDAFAKEIEDLRSLEDMATKAMNGRKTEGGGPEDKKDRDRKTERKSFGQHFVESAAYKVKGAAAELDIELKALFDTATGWVPETTRGPRIVESAQRPIQVADLIPTVPTTQSAVTYMEETTFTNAAAETAEGAAKPEATLALTEKTSTVRKVAVWIPVTDETFEDIPRFMAYLDNRLPFMVRQRLDLQIISGNGTAPNLRGIMNVVGVQTQAKGTDPTPDAVYKAMTKVEVTGQAMPDAAIFHPNDWQDIRLLRTADGIYIWGNPSEAGPERIWGLRVVKAQAATENTAIVGDFGNFSELAVKSGIEVQVSNSHSTFFTENKQAVRAEMRAAFLVYRPTAFCLVTGI